MTSATMTSPEAASVVSASAGPASAPSPGTVARTGATGVAADTHHDQEQSDVPRCLPGYRRDRAHD
jgi:hypothetical protein